MKPNHVTLTDLKEHLSLSYLEYWTILDLIEKKVGMVNIYYYIIYNLPKEELESLVEKLTIKNCIIFNDDEYDTLKKLRD